MRVMMPDEVDLGDEASVAPPREVLRRFLQPTLGASLLALAFALIGLVTQLVRAVDTTLYRPDDLWLTVLVLLASLPLVIVRRWPLLTLVIVMGAVAAESIAGYQPIGIGIWTGGAALFVTVAFDSVRNAVIGGLVAAGGLLVYQFADAAGPDWETMAAAWGAYSFTWTTAFLIRIYRSSASRAETRAALFAADREARAREAVSNERARLARELHDSVGHALNVVVLQSAGAQRVLEKKPELAVQALTAIETAGRQALADIERMLGILRAERGEESFESQPGLGRLDDLVARVREAGLPVDVVVTGEPKQMPPSLDLSAYRIVQEALTNTLKHAGKAHSRITLHWTDDQLAIEVVDDGRGAAAAPTSGGGRGLLGIRERVRLFGGELLVGPRQEGGFGVWARLPLADPTAGLASAPGVGVTAVSASAVTAAMTSAAMSAGNAVMPAGDDRTSESTNGGGTE